MTNHHPYLTIEVTVAAEVHTIVLIGEADLLGAPNIEAAFADAAAGDARRIVVDLRKLTFIDSSGLQTLITGHQQCLARDRELSIVPGPASVQRLFEIAGMSDALPFCAAEDLPGADTSSV